LRSQNNDESEDENFLSLDEIEKIAKYKRKKISNVKKQQRKERLMKQWEENHYKSYNLLMDECK